jgi:hypothetical protein
VVRGGLGDLVEGGSSPADLGDDLVCGAVPDEGLGVVVPVLGPVIDGRDELVAGAEAAPADALVGTFAVVSTGAPSASANSALACTTRRCGSTVERATRSSSARSASGMSSAPAIPEPYVHA